jgi:uncharacterized membrane protein YdjX (TVP38/TMEM64 family)
VDTLLVNLAAITIGIVAGFLLGRFMYEEPPWSAS